jgi:hypothetical protein
MRKYLFEVAVTAGGKVLAAVEVEAPDAFHAMAQVNSDLYLKLIFFGPYKSHSTSQTERNHMKKKVSILLLAVALAGCAAAKIHPGSPNVFDSSSYDALIVAHSIIETTKTDLANNAFPATIAGNVKTALNGMIQAYNAADSAYQAYHQAALAGTATATQQAAVQTQLDRVNLATSALTSAKAGQ